MPDASPPTEIERSRIEHCAALLRTGGVVAIPTETVYGLGANALDTAAVARVFALKERPRTSPLIVHVANVAAARALSDAWPEAAERLAARFWPGPLTLIVPKSDRIPDLVTAGLPTVGLRVPAHPAARALLAAAGVPVAAPSANPFTRLSATSAEHVRAAFGDRLDAILDAGPSRVGIESSVVSCIGAVPRLLRPGAIPTAELRSVTPELVVPADDRAPPGAHASPGQHPRHYSPHTPLLLRALPDELPAGRGAWIHRTGPRGASGVDDIALPDDPAGYAALLYATLHDLDARELDWIAIEPPPAGDAWDAVRDRLRRATAD